MCRFHQLLQVLILAIFPTLMACEKGSSYPPEVQLDCYELHVDGGGGDIVLFYGVSYGIKGERPSAKSNVDWISIGEITSSQIILKVEPSDISEERFGIVTVSYPNMKDNISVYVLQDKQLLNQYRFEVSNLTHSGCTVKYIPKDPHRPFMANVIDAEYFKQSGITDERVFVENEMNNYIALAQRNNMTLEELMSRVSPKLVYVGEAEREFTDMQPGGSYLVYSYGVEFMGNSYEMTTPMHSTLVELPMPEMYDVKFNINSTINGNVASIGIDPGSWTGYYCVQIAPDDSLQFIEPGETMSDVAMKSLAAKFYSDARKAMSGGMSAEQYMRSKCQTGFRTLEVQLTDAKRYMVIVFAVESLDGSVPIMRSVPTLYYLYK